MANATDTRRLHLVLYFGSDRFQLKDVSESEVSNLASARERKVFKLKRQQGTAPARSGTLFVGPSSRKLILALVIGAASLQRLPDSGPSHFFFFCQLYNRPRFHQSRPFRFLKRTKFPLAPAPLNVVRSRPW